MNKIIGDLVKNTQYGTKIKNDFNNEMVNKTYQYYKKYNFEWDTGDGPTHNNESDAFKHAFMQAVLYHRASKMSPIAKDTVGNTYSKILGDYHETETPGADKGETNMDLWNNEVGREIAKEVRQKLGSSVDKLDDKYVEDYFAKEIMNRMRNGEFITRPDDKRDVKNRYQLTKTSISKPDKNYNNKDGHWVTIHGHHVFIDK